MFALGLDLGQRVDHSAIVVVERQVGSGAVLVRHAERVMLGTPYPRVVARVREMVQHGELAGECRVAVDATGVGQPVVEMLQAARLGCEIQAVTMTGGARASCTSGWGGTAWTVPKVDLLAGVQVLLERGELRIAPGLREVGPLVRELLDVRGLGLRATGGRRGGLRFGAEGGGAHDDLVIALALGCWSLQRKGMGFGNRRLTGI